MTASYTVTEKRRAYWQEDIQILQIGSGLVSWEFGYDGFQMESTTTESLTMRMPRHDAICTFIYHDVDGEEIQLSLDVFNFRAATRVQTEDENPPMQKYITVSDILWLRRNKQVTNAKRVKHGCLEVILKRFPNPQIAIARVQVDPIVSARIAAYRQPDLNLELHANENGVWFLEMPLSLADKLGVVVTAGAEQIIIAPGEIPHDR